ncbi:uncharacterized protein UBRO2_05552 [Ustilago bromivora]|uniref:DUF1748-domain-containing protein n=1 Tax=Ustilago bromivora TaxID=307758 RepID=A0A8H8QRQ6_9BASI|nr:uncharacterized protein UBRO2_05552 [Ustilago bromivora]
MVIGRLMHYVGDALLISTVLAGIKRQTGLRPDIDRISEPTTKGLLEKYLGFGEFVFDSSVAAATASSLFQKDMLDRLQGPGASSPASDGKALTIGKTLMLDKSLSIELNSSALGHSLTRVLKTAISGHPKAALQRSYRFQSTAHLIPPTL